MQDFVHQQYVPTPTVNPSNTSFLDEHLGSKVAGVFGLVLGLGDVGDREGLPQGSKYPIIIYSPKS